MADDDSINGAAVASACFHHLAETLNRKSVLIASVRIERDGLSSSSSHRSGIFGKSWLDDEEPLKPQCTRKHIDQFRGTITDHDLFRIDTPERGQRLPQIPTVGIGIVAQQMRGRRDGFPDLRRGPQWVDAGAEIKNLSGIAVQFSCGTVDIPAMHEFLQA